MAVLDAEQIALGVHAPERTWKRKGFPDVLRFKDAAAAEAEDEDYKQLFHCIGFYCLYFVYWCFCIPLGLQRKSRTFPKTKKHLSSPLEGLSINWREDKNIKNWISICCKTEIQSLSMGLSMVLMRINSCFITKCRLSHHKFLRCYAHGNEIHPSGQ